MNLAKKLSLFAYGITSAFISTAVITGTYIPAVQAAEIVQRRYRTHI